MRLCPEVVVHDGLKKWWNDEKNFEHCRKINEAQSHERRRTTMGWKEFLRRARNSKKKLELEIDDLKTIWEQQEGKCALFGHSLILPYPKKKVNHNYLASIDRIDHTQGYTKDNIRIICATANYARNKFTDEHLYEFIKLCTLKSN